MKGLLEKIQELPVSIWVDGPFPSIYRGSPTEMVEAMASEMGKDISVREAVSQLCSALAEHRRIGIHLPKDVPEDLLAGMFVSVLLSSGLARPMAAA